MLDSPVWPSAASTSKLTMASLPLSRTFPSTKAAAHTSNSNSNSNVKSNIACTKTGSAPVSSAGPFALDAVQAKQLSLFLKSKRSTVKLRLADIAGVTDESGQFLAPAVRRGKIPAAGHGSAGVPCCLIDRMPFERCEVVAMVVKKTVLYNTCREYLYSGSGAADDKGKGKATDPQAGYIETDEKGRLYINRTHVGKIFYDCESA